MLTLEFHKWSAEPIFFYSVPLAVDSFTVNATVVTSPWQQHT